MFATNHVLIGSAIGLATKNPYIALPVGIASHFLFDLTPHFGFKDKETKSKYYIKVAKFDGILLLLYLAFITLFFSSPIPLLAGAIGGLLPDLDKPFEYFIGKKIGKNLWPTFINKFHWGIQNENPKFIYTEIVAFILFNLILFNSL